MTSKMHSNEPGIHSGPSELSSPDEESLFGNANSTPAQQLRSLGISPSKALGQHFLHDGQIVRRIVATAGVSPDDNVLEIGPGLGILTAELVRNAGTVVAVEMDSRLAQRLDQLAPENLTVLHADARDIDPATIYSAPYLVVANLPYSVGNIILRRLQESTNPPETLTVMLQHEVAQRIVASPPNMSLLSTAVQFFGDPEIAFRVGRGAFSPPPNVDSAVLHIRRRCPPIPRESWADFFDLVRSGYSQRRKQLVNTLRLNSEFSRLDVTDALKCASLRPTVRAQQLAVDHWVNLFELLFDCESN